MSRQSQFPLSFVRLTSLPFFRINLDFPFSVICSSQLQIIILIATAVPSAQMSLVSALILLALITGPIIASPIRSNTRDADNLDCSPNTPLDVILFLVLNYIAHTATVLHEPGVRWTTRLKKTLCTLFNPSYGLINAYRALADYIQGLNSSNELDEAASYGALLLVQRSGTWKLRTECLAPGLQVNGNNTAVRVVCPSKEHMHWTSQRINDPKKKPKLHGQISKNLHDEGYELAVVPSEAQIRPNMLASANSSLKLASSKNVLSSIVGLAQALFTCYTLYQTSGPQVSQSGYAAYAFTVNNYVVMTMVNLAVNAVVNTYPTMFLVRSEVMDEAESRGVSFDGVVGQIVTRNNTYGLYSIPAIRRFCLRGEPKFLNTFWFGWISWLSILVLVCGPAIGVMAVMSHFQPEVSSTFERASSLLWVFGPAVLWLVVPVFNRLTDIPLTSLMTWPIPFGVVGMAMVGPEMVASKHCVRKTERALSNEG